MDNSRQVPVEPLADPLRSENGLPPHVREKIARLIAPVVPADASAPQGPLGILGENAGTSESSDADRTVQPSALREGPGATIGRYKLLQVIGEGGCGTVFMAEQTFPVKRRVAVKIIKLGMDTKQVIARFEAERQALAIMEDQNIAKVLDAGATESGRPYFVMELVKGVPLTEYCDREKLSTRRRMELFVSVCNAIQHAHHKGIIHRDIKPSNILVSVSDGAPVPKVIDFGIAKATTGQLTDKTLVTEYRQLIGTPEYMSPEQAEMSGIDIDTRSDIYSLGVMLYKLLTGTTPFESKELRTHGHAEIQRMIREIEPPNPSTRLSTLGQTLITVAQRHQTEPRRLQQIVKGELDWIVMKCLEKDRTRRYETANGLAKDVQRYLNDEPIVARPSSRSYRFKKFAKKHKWEAAAVAAIAAALLLGIIGTTTFALRATFNARAERQARRTAQQASQRALASEAAAQKARKESDVNRELAERERDQAKAANAFVTNMFSSMSLEKSNSTTFSIKQILDAAVQDLDHGALKGQPQVEADLRRRLADMYGGASLYQQALAQAEKSRDLLKTIYPDGSEALGRCLIAYGNALAKLNDRRAESVLTQALEMQRRFCTPQSDDLADALEALGGFDALHPAKARLLLEEAMQIRQASGNQARIGNNLNLLAALANNEREFAKAESLWEQSLAIFRTVHGEEHPSVAMALSSLGVVLFSEGKNEEARQKLSEALKLDEKLLGRLSDRVAWDLSNLSLALWGLADYPRAASCAQESLDIQRRLTGPEHPEAQNNTVGLLTLVFLAHRDYSQAESLLLDQGRRLRAAGKSTADNELPIAQMLVKTYRAWPKPREHAEWSERIRTLLYISVADKSEQVHLHPGDADHYVNRGRLYVRLGRLSDASRDFQRAIQLDPTNHWPWYYQACLLAYRQDGPGYIAHCVAMLKQFSGSTEVGPAARASKSSLLLPGTDAAAVAVLIDTYARAVAGVWHNPFYEEVKGMDAYRRGQFQPALDWLSKARSDISADDLQVRLTIELLRAMTEYRLGHIDQSREIFETARQQIQTQVPRLGEDLAAVGGIEDWLILQVALREAQAMFDSGPASRGATSTRPAL